MGLTRPAGRKASASRMRIGSAGLRCWRRSRGGKARQVLARHPADSQVRLDLACLRRWLQTPDKLHKAALAWLGHQAEVVEDGHAQG